MKVLPFGKFGYQCKINKKDKEHTKLLVEELKHSLVIDWQTILKNRNLDKDLSLWNEMSTSGPGYRRILSSWFLTMTLIIYILGSSSCLFVTFSIICTLNIFAWGFCWKKKIERKDYDDNDMWRQIQTGVNN